MRDLLKVIWSDIRAKRLRYWLFAAAFIVGGIAASSYLDKYYLLLGLRYTAYQMIQHTNPWEAKHSQRVVLVVIGDKEFWKEGLDHRVPVKRDYLASLVKILDAADPEVLAVDYTLRSPVADGSLVETPTYAKETNKLITAIEKTKNSEIILPATVNEYSYEEGTRSYLLDSNVFGNHRFLNPRVKWGYLNLSRDIRRIPLAVRIRGGGSPVPSFSQQIAATLDPESQVMLHFPETIYGTFMPVTGFVSIAAGQVLADPAGAWRARVKHKAVIIGSFAHEDAYDRGPYMDSFQTPLGDVPGVVVHANYVEALFRGNVSPLSPDWANEAAEILLSLSVSILVARKMGAIKKLLYFLIFLGSAFLLSYFLLRNLAVFFDPVLPVLAVALHSLCERALAPHQEHEAPYGGVPKALHS